MNSNETKYFINAFKQMVMQHPELCPHDYVLYDTNFSNRLNKFRCKICGDAVARPMTKEDIERFTKPKDNGRGGKRGKNTTK